jgi:hypothetical protein
LQEVRVVKEQGKPSSELDQDELCGALRALGMLYGARQLPAAVTAGGPDEAEAIRAYIERERPHLLKTYDIETLIELVRAARAAHSEGASALEQFGPR